MEFGFGFLVLFFVIFFGVGRMCGWGRRCRRDDQGELGPSDKEYERRLSDLESRVKGRVASGAVSDRLVRPMANRSDKPQATERARLGEAFDMRAFSDAILRAGPVPFDLIPEVLAGG